MSAAQSKQKVRMPPLGVWGPAVAVGWLVPGGGHFLQKRYGRAALLFVAVAAMYVFGLMMRGTLYEPARGPDWLTTLIYYGGFIGDMCSGIFYLMTVWLGYTQPEIAGAVNDYGTKFLVTAGLLNVLAMVDAYEIAAGRKD